MKIPQREDLIALEAPRTQPGKAAMPIEGSLGDSYITAMRGMSKQFNEISDLQFNLAKNAMEGQLNSFDIYVQARTKQYNQELGKATSEEQINDLVAKYQIDIANTGNEMLGEKRFEDWFNVKGGNTVVGSTYAAKVSAAQLQINLNNERLDNQLRELNTLAGTAQTPEEREQYVSQVDEILKQNVANGTVSEAKALEKKEGFNYDLTVSLVIKSMEDDPAKTADKLRNDKNFAPILNFPDRMRLAEQAEETAAKREGTIHAKIEEQVISLWQPLYDSSNMQLRGEAYRIKDLGQNLTALKQWMAKASGMHIDKISNKDALNFRSYMDTVIGYKDQDRNMAFFEKYASTQETETELFYDKKKGKKTPVTDWATSYSNKNNSRLENADQALDLYNQHKAFINNTYDRTIMTTTGNGKKFEESENTKNALADIFVNDVEKKHLPREGWYKQFQEVLTQATKRLEENGDLDGNNKQKLRIFTRSLADRANLSETFKDGNDYRPAVMQAYADMLGVPLAELGDKGYRFANSLYNSPNLELWSDEKRPSAVSSTLKRTGAQIKYGFGQWGNRLVGNPERFK